MIDAFLMFWAAIAVVRKFSKDPEAGWAWLVGLMLIFPLEVRLELPGALPQFTAHRMLLGLGIWMVLRSRSGTDNWAPAPLMKAFGFMAFLQFCSALGATEQMASLKDWLGFVTEQFLFVWMVWHCIRTPRGVRFLLWSVAAAMVTVGLIAAFERYGGINLAARLIPGMKDNYRSVTATFRHRILFGYFMAIGLPMMLAFVAIQQSKWGKRLAWTGLLLSGAGSYLSFSRGPWLGAVLGSTFLAWVGGKRVRRILTVLSVMAVVVLLTRPGVYDTLSRLYEHTKTTDTQKGRSFHYRLELWGVAWRMLSTSTERSLFGFGGGSLETMDLTEAFEYGGNAGSLGYTSWDSEIAAMFMKFGILGMVAAVALYGSAGLRLLRAWRASVGDDRLIIAGCAGSFGVFMFCMTNVAIFNPQVRFVAWLAVVIGLKIAWLAQQLPESESPDASDESEESSDSNSPHADDEAPEEISKPWR